jgi:GNAT superfamily N-acetyltransferase
MKKEVTISEPHTDAEWGAYFYCRWKTLRQPWGHPRGSEQTEGEEDCYHAMAATTSGVCGVARIQQLEEGEWQIRFMGVVDEWHGKGIGKKLLEYLVQLARSKGAENIILHARENAVVFYEKCDFKQVKPSYLLWDTIQHVEMKRQL